MAEKKKFFLVSTKAKGLEFEIIKLDRDAMRATLQGETGVPFETSIQQAELDKYGYTVDIRMVEVPDENVPAQPA